MEKYTRVLVFILIVCGFLSVSCSRAQDEESMTRSKTNKEVTKVFPPAPDFDLDDIYQDAYRLSSYKNKQPVLLFFWTTWCPFCRSELKVLNDMYATLQKDGIEVLAINVGEVQSKVEDFVKNYYLAYKVLLDRDTRVSQSYEVAGVPTYALIDKEGYVVFHENFFPRKEYKDLIEK